MAYLTDVKLLGREAAAALSCNLTKLLVPLIVSGVGAACMAASLSQDTQSPYHCCKHHRSLVSSGRSLTRPEAKRWSTIWDSECDRQEVVGKVVTVSVTGI